MSRRARGQALPFGLLLLLVGLLAWGQSYQWLQLVNAKQRLLHVVDAAAYSGALAQARALNLTAWLSRTQLAHQVALAHVATLAAWADFGARQAQRQALGNPPVFLIRRLFGVAYGRAYGAAAAAASGSSADWLSAYAAHDAQIHEVLEQARRDALAMLPAWRLAAMQTTIQRNLARTATGWAAAEPASFVLTILSDSWPGRVTWQHSVPERGAHAWLSGLASRTPFLAARERTVGGGLPAAPACPYLRHELRRRGQTALDTDGRWRARDTLSFHAVRQNRWVGCYFRAYPMGWAAAAATSADVTEAAPRHFGRQAFWRWLQTRTDWPLLGRAGNPLAERYADEAQRHLPSRGVTPDLALATGEIRFAIGVAAPIAQVQLAGAASRVSPSKHWRLPDRVLDGELRVSSAAAVEYVHPQGVAGVAQANLYLPYWQARLAPVRAAERAFERRQAP